ncbi:MAG: XRE family transcriptional regulator [Polyangia bacterium]|jgi:DNA-binding phage protein
MKTKHAKTGFDRYFTDRMKDREFAAAYAEARAGIDSVDAFVRSLDDVRSKAGVSKALLAKRTGTQPAAMRRLLTMDAPNPTLATVMTIVRSLGYSLALVPAQGRSKRGRARKLAGVLAATA